MAKVMIHSISNISAVNLPQTRSLIDQFTNSTPPTENCIPARANDYKNTVLKSPKMAALLKSRETRKLQKLSAETILFCFDEVGNYVCSSDGLSVANHDLVLPRSIRLQAEKAMPSLTFSDKIKLLTQCSLYLDGNDMLQLPWELLCRQQLLNVAEYWEVEITSTQKCINSNNLASFLKPLCSSASSFRNSGATDILHTLFEFSFDNIFNCVNADFDVLANQPAGSLFQFVIDQRSIADTAPREAVTPSRELSTEQQTAIEDQETEGYQARSSDGMEVENVVEMNSLQSANATQLSSIKELLKIIEETEGSTSDLLGKSHEYQQLRTTSPTEDILFCFNKKDEVVCLATDLTDAKHIIIIPDRIQQIYHTDLVHSLSFADKKKILYQQLVSKMCNGVAEVPWYALTLPQLASITSDRCPDYRIKDANIMGNINPCSFLAAKLKSSKQYKQQFKDPKHMDTYTLFGFPIDEPLKLDWSIEQTENNKKWILETKALFSTNMYLSPEKKRRTAENDAVRDAGELCIRLPGKMGYLEARDEKEKNVEDSPTEEEKEEKEEEEDMTRNVSLITEPDITEPDITVTETSELDTVDELDADDTYVGQLDAISGDRETQSYIAAVERTQDLQNSTPRDWFLENTVVTSTPKKKNNEDSHDSNQSSVKKIDFTISEDFEIISIPPMSSEVTSSKGSEICTRCSRDCTNQMLSCFLCQSTVHYDCYSTSNSNKTLAATYFNTANTKLPNHKWFCNSCNTLSAKDVLDKISCRARETIKSGTSPGPQLSRQPAITQLNRTLEDQVDVMILQERRSCTIEHELKLLSTCLRDSKTQAKDSADLFQKLINQNNKLLQQISSNLSNSRTPLVAKSGLKKPLYSDQARDPRYEGAVYHTHKPVEPTVVTDCTVIISNIKDRRLVKDGSTIKKNFNKVYKDLKIANAFTSKGGSVFVELMSKDDARTVVNTWKESYFIEHQAKSVQPGSKCKLLADLSKSVIIKGVSTAIEEIYINNTFNEIYPGASATRFIKKDSTVLKVVKIDFKTHQDQQHCLAEGILIEGIKYDPEEYKPRQRVVQCYNCYRFGHVAKFCKDSHHTCRHCSGKHSDDKCRSDNPLKCRNCGGRHIATHKQCTAYLDVTKQIQLKEKSMRNQTANHHNDQ